MIKAHVQIPDELYRAAKKVAASKEWSFAEITRRGLEYMTSVNQVPATQSDWALPLVKVKGGRPVSEKALEEAKNAERDASFLI
ncbi:MAG: antitoxin [Verrucomicrobiota bacterium]